MEKSTGMALAAKLRETADKVERGEIVALILMANNKEEDKTATALFSEELEPLLIALMSGLKRENELQKAWAGATAILAHHGDEAANEAIALIKHAIKENGNKETKTN